MLTPSAWVVNRAALSPHVQRQPTGVVERKFCQIVWEYERPMAARGLPHYWTPDQVKMILDAMPAGQPWLFALLLWRTALRQAEALNLEWRDLQFAGT